MPDAWKEFDPNEGYQVSAKLESSVCQDNWLSYESVLQISKFIQIYLFYMTAQRFETTKPTVTAVVVSPGRMNAV